MLRIAGLSLVIAISLCGLSPPSPAHAQAAVSITVDAAPPPLPIYEQPPIPGAGYMWVPGYWAWADDVGYYWVPGTWVLPPEPELLWTPGYWGWNDGAYIFNAGYWGPTVGFYGGVAYGFGYTGSGYEGGYWRGGNFFYNRTVNNITNVSITNVYNKTVINNRTTVSYNGGPGGTTVRPTPDQIAADKEHHVPATAEQGRHAEAAMKDPALSLARNHGHPSVAATAHPAQFSGSGIVAAHPGKPIAAPPARHAQPTTEKPNTAGAPVEKEKREVATPPKPQMSRRPPAASVKRPSSAPRVARPAPRPVAAPPRRPPPPHVAPRPAPRPQPHSAPRAAAPHAAPQKRR
jgi:WXXGXW repeat (2 copies)